MPAKSRTASDTTFDRRRTPSTDEEHERAGDGAGRQRRTTRDGRQPLVVYLQPLSIKALKIRALENDTTASAIVAEAVDAWLRTQSKR